MGVLCKRVSIIDVNESNLGLLKLKQLGATIVKSLCSNQTSHLESRASGKSILDFSNHARKIFNNGLNLLFALRLNESNIKITWIVSITDVANEHFSAFAKTRRHLHSNPNGSA